MIVSPLFSLLLAVDGSKLIITAIAIAVQPSLSQPAPSSPFPFSEALKKVQACD